ncbi:hypothetical protein RFI_29537 [Reticulomyxa filosa]|uniref:Uncharacterized protein n=1 Tax=Reticulomyxa filosa TaxID=46433 RepID=X6M496_RETFI|nr:hypothetical protein RFI_29537 [Reticulomyxa filosa]|eukprot:ETO07850.1 hypothetical protein RFI_29537 [Reticulomyxa filosa]
MTTKTSLSLQTGHNKEEYWFINDDDVCLLCNYHHSFYYNHILVQTCSNDWFQIEMNEMNQCIDIIFVILQRISCACLCVYNYKNILKPKAISSCGEMLEKISNKMLQKGKIFFNVIVFRLTKKKRKVLMTPFNINTLLEKRFLAQKCVYLLIASSSIQSPTSEIIDQNKSKMQIKQNTRENGGNKKEYKAFFHYNTCMQRNVTLHNPQEQRMIILLTTIPFEVEMLNDIILPFTKGLLQGEKTKLSEINKNKNSDRSQTMTDLSRHQNVTTNTYSTTHWY